MSETFENFTQPNQVAGDTTEANGVENGVQDDQAGAEAGGGL